MRRSVKGSRAIGCVDCCFRRKNTIQSRMKPGCGGKKGGIRVYLPRWEKFEPTTRKRVATGSTGTTWVPGEGRDLAREKGRNVPELGE